MITYQAKGSVLLLHSLPCPRQSIVSMYSNKMVIWNHEVNTDNTALKRNGSSNTTHYKLELFHSHGHQG